VNQALEQAVRARAGGLCEYCHAAERHYIERFQIDHVVARQHGGPTVSDNLALCCLPCNLKKGPNIGSIDPATGMRVDLFNPRQDAWNDHFEWHGALLVARTPVGRATLNLLELNRATDVHVRQALLVEGEFPPPGDRRVWEEP
jgi:hypothetical protein